MKFSRFVKRSSLAAMLAASVAVVNANNVEPQTHTQNICVKGAKWAAKTMLKYMVVEPLMFVGKWILITDATFSLVQTKADLDKNQNAALRFFNHMKNNAMNGASTLKDAIKG